MDSGLGIIMFTIAVLPIFGVSGLQVFAAEASGPTHDKVHPRIGITAKWIWSIYAGLTLILVVLLMLGGMNWFDSVCHAFATTGTGGFSTKQASVAYYNSPYIEYVISIFMFISGINFTLLLFFVNRKFKKVIDNAELKLVFLVGSRLYRCDSRSALLHRFNGCGRGFPQIIVPGHIAAHLHRLCHRRLYVMDTCALGASYHCHGDGSLCRQHFRRSEMYPYGHSGQSIPQ